MILKPYPKYKDSSIQWVGKIPEEWEVERYKIRFKYVKGRIPENLEETNEEGHLPYLSMGYLRGNEEGILYANNPNSIRVSERDLLLLWDGSNAGEFVLGKNGYLSSTMVKLNFKNLNSNFSFYLCKSFEALLRDLTIGMGIPHVNGDTLGNIRIPLPNSEDQTGIANFLDKKTVKIDYLIEKDKILIELLKERRAALINHAVTKGLNQNVKFKDSGIEWIGKIPEGWEVHKIKNTSYVKGRIGWQGLTSEEYSDEGAYLVTGTDFKNGVIEWDDCHHIGWDRYKEDPYIHLKEDDLLITKDGTIGKVALIKILPNKATLNSGIFLVRPLNKKYTPKFMYWMLNSAVFERFFDYIKTGATISHLYQETFERFFFPIPPKSEQHQIAQYLDKATVKIDKTIQKIEQKIKLLEEYKKSLIHHTVTGKVDVREVKI